MSKPFIFGADCGQCHQAIPENIFYHIDQLYFQNTVPQGEGIYRTWGAEDHMPATPIPGTILLLALPLALVIRALKDKP